MEPKEEADLLLITTRRFLHVRIYIFENSIPVLGIRRIPGTSTGWRGRGGGVTVTVELVLSVLICLDVEGTHQSDYLLMKYCSKCMTLNIQHIMTR